MTGLIPLMLSSGGSSNRDSQFLPSSPLQLHRRRPSSGILPALVPSRPARPKSKRLSITPPAVLPVLPYTAADWRRTISEIKRQYVARRYRACFTRCAEILDGLKDTVRTPSSTGLQRHEALADPRPQANTEPTYLIYLHFYAATSMETCARPLFSTSPYRAQLLTDARAHYDRAAELIRRAESAAAPRTRPSSVLSTASSLHSPAGSVSSRAWTSETDMTSPTQSVCSLEDLVGSASSPTPTAAAKKKVSFCTTATAHAPPAPHHHHHPVFLRPDSPTLGLDDGLSPSAAPPRSALPEPPTPPLSDAADDARAHEDDDEDDEATPRALARRPARTTPAPDQAPHEFHRLRQSLLLAGPVNRYYEGLAALKARLAAHRSELDALLLAPAAAESPSAATPARATTPTPESEELRCRDRRARIERLRASGWQRKRFDFRRYEELRSAALAELN